MFILRTVHRTRRYDTLESGGQMKAHRSLWLWSLLLLFFVGLLLSGQRRRAPWKERSPAVGSSVPDGQVYDENLKPIKLSNLYKDTLLVIQWGGCT